MRTTVMASSPACGGRSTAPGRWHYRSDRAETAIARKIIALAASLGLEVIAEGVETEEQRAFLATNGWSAFQGFLFSRPLTI